MKSNKFLLPVINQTIDQRVLTPAAMPTEVVVTNLGDEATLLWAVSLPLVELFDPL